MMKFKTLERGLVDTLLYYCPVIYFYSNWCIGPKTGPAVAHDNGHKKLSLEQKNAPQPW